MATSGKNSKTPKACAPRLAARATTIRLVEVPSVVDMPPISTAKFIGINIRAGERPARVSAAISSGISSTTTGVSFITPLTPAATSSTARSASRGDFSTSHASRRAAGSSAPVSTSAWPRTISAQMATSAGWPKPLKKRNGSTCGLGKTKNSAGSRISTARQTEPS